jgi:hypothetical protein
LRFLIWGVSRRPLKSESNTQLTDFAEVNRPLSDSVMRATGLFVD